MHIYILLFLALFIILFVILKKKTREGNTGVNIGVMPIQVATDFNIDDAINNLQNKCDRGDIPACKYIAKKQGFSLGGGGYNFDGAYNTNGLYTYNSKYWSGMAFFGTRAGTDSAKNSKSLSGLKKRINTTDRNKTIKDKNQCWKKMPTGCDNRLSETNTPENWFIDYKSLDANTCDSRKGAFNSYCRKRDAEGSWGKYPEKLDECAGHCGIDADCKDGLICSTKIQDEDWPGCSKDIEENKKYCKNEQKNAEMNEISKVIYENIREGMTSSEIIIPTSSELSGVFTNAKKALVKIEKMLVEQKKISQHQNCNNNNGIHKKKKFLDDISDLINTNLLKQIIGFSIKDEMKLVNLIEGLNENYSDLKDCAGNSSDNPEYSNINNKISALKIIKWHISMSYITYFDESTYDNIKNIKISSPILLGEEGVNALNNSISEVFTSVKNYLMNKLNIAIGIGDNELDPVGELTTFMRANLTNNTLNVCSTIDASHKGPDCVNPRSDIFDNKKKIILSSPKTEVELGNLIKIFPWYLTFEKVNSISIKRMNKTKTRNPQHPPGAYFKESDKSNEITVYWGSAITNEFQWEGSVYLPAKFPLWGLDLTVEKCGPIQVIKSMKATKRNDDYNLWLDRCSGLPLDKCSSKTEWTAPRPMGSGGRCEIEGFTNMEKIIKQNKIVQKINTFKQNRVDDVMSFFKKNVLKTGIIEGLGFNTTKTKNVNIFFSKGDSDDTNINDNGELFHSIHNVDFDAKIGDRWYKYNLKASGSMADNGWQLNEKVKEILVKIYDDRNEIFKADEITNNAANNAAKNKIYTDRNDINSSDNDAGWGIPKSNGMDWYQNTDVKIYKSDLLNLVDWDNTVSFKIGVESDPDNPIKEKLKTASINLYVNDDGYSFITVIPDDSSQGQSWTGKDSNEDELIKKVIVDINALKSDKKENEQKYYFYGSQHKNDVGGFSISTPVKCGGKDQCDPYPLIANGRSLMIMPRGMFYIKFSAHPGCPDGFEPNTDVGNSQTCKGKNYDTLCRLNYISPENTDNTKSIPRCYSADGSENTELGVYKKECVNITGMKAEDPADPHKCITDETQLIPNTKNKNFTENELRSCYLYNKSNDPSRTTCNPKKAKNEYGCLCKFDKTYDNTGLTGKPIVEDSVCEVLGDTDLTYSECLEYARWDTGDDTTRVGNDAYFNIDTDDLGHRKGCQKNNDQVDFQYIHPNKTYGKKTRVRKWGENELVTLGKLNYESICKKDYVIQQEVKVATDIDDGEPEIVNNITIPGIRDDKTSSGNYLITEVTDTERGYAKLNCDAKNSWDACYMQGNQTSLNEGERLVEDAGYSEFKLYPEEADTTEADTTEADTTEGFMGFRKTIREGATGSRAQIYGSGGCLKNCAPRRFKNGNCDEDIKTTKTVDGIQRFFKMCPQECLGPTPQGAESNGYEDIDKGGTVGPDGTTIKYDAAIHGCRTSKQCEETCNKSAIQMKHVYDNICDDEDCNDDQFKEQYEYNDNLVDDGIIELDSTIKITTVLMTDALIRKYNKEGGIAQNFVDGVGDLKDEGNVQRERAIFKFIEELKKKSVSQIIGFSYQTDGDKLLIIYKKANVFAKINITPNGNEGKWKTYIHKRKWEDYWDDPNRKKLPKERNLTEREMQRMQGIDLGISMDAFDKIPLYWQNSKTKEANFDDICEWVNDKIKAGELKPKDKCSDSFKSSWASRTLGIGKAPTKGLNFEEFEQVFNLRQTAVQGSSYTDMTNNMDIGQTDLSLDDYYKRNLLKSKVENRLGGSDNAYTKTYKPLNPDARPKFFNSAWGLFH